MIHTNEPQNRLPLFLATLSSGDHVNLDTIRYTVTHVERSAGFIHLENDKRRPYLLEIPDAIGLPRRMILSSNGGRGRPIAAHEVTVFDSYTPVKIQVTAEHIAAGRAEFHPIACPLTDDYAEHI